MTPRMQIREHFAGYDNITQHGPSSQPPPRAQAGTAAASAAPGLSNSTSAASAVFVSLLSFSCEESFDNPARRESRVQYQLAGPLERSPSAQSVGAAESPSNDDDDGGGVGRGEQQTPDSRDDDQAPAADADAASHPGSSDAATDWNPPVEIAIPEWAEWIHSFFVKSTRATDDSFLDAMRKLFVAAIFLYSIAQLAVAVFWLVGGATELAMTPELGALVGGAFGVALPLLVACPCFAYIKWTHRAPEGLLTYWFVGLFVCFTGISIGVPLFPSYTACFSLVHVAFVIRAQHQWPLMVLGVVAYTVCAYNVAFERQREWTRLVLPNPHVATGTEIIVLIFMGPLFLLLIVIVLHLQVVDYIRMINHSSVLADVARELAECVRAGNGRAADRALDKYGESASANAFMLNVLRNVARVMDACSRFVPRDVLAGHVRQRTLHQAMNDARARENDDGLGAEGGGAEGASQQQLADFDTRVVTVLRLEMARFDVLCEITALESVDVRISACDSVNKSSDSRAGGGPASFSGSTSDPKTDTAVHESSSDPERHRSAKSIRSNARLAELLDLYYTACERIAGQHGATLVECSGGRCVLLWGAPGLCPRMEALACCAALRLLGVMQDDLAPRFRACARGFDLAVRIGVHRDGAVVGNIGHAAGCGRAAYTVTGTAPTVACALSRLNKLYDGSCVIASSDVSEAAGEQLAASAGGAAGARRVTLVSRPLASARLQGRHGVTISAVQLVGVHGLHSNCVSVSDSLASLPRERKSRAPCEGGGRAGAGVDDGGGGGSAINGASLRKNAAAQDTPPAVALVDESAALDTSATRSGSVLCGSQEGGANGGGPSFHAAAAIAVSLRILLVTFFVPEGAAEILGQLAAALVEYERRNLVQAVEICQRIVDLNFALDSADAASRVMRRQRINRQAPEALIARCRAAAQTGASQIGASFFLMTLTDFEDC